MGKLFELLSHKLLRPTKRSQIFGIGLLLISAAACCWYQYEKRSIQNWNAEQKRSAVNRLKQSASCPPAVLKIGEERTVFKMKDDRERIFKHHSEITEELNLLDPSYKFVWEGPPDSGKLSLKGEKLCLRSDSYLTLFFQTAHLYGEGVIMKIRASGRGRIAPYSYCSEENVNIAVKPDREFSIPPYRIASLGKRDYYFYLPRGEGYEKQCAGLRMKGNLDIEQITVIEGKDQREKETSIVAARILETSEIPDPEKSPYPDCLYAVKVKILLIEKWGDDLTEELVLLVPAFRNRKKTPESKWKKGDLVHISMIRVQKETEAVRAIQQSDTLDDFDSERYSLTRLVTPQTVRPLSDPEKWEKVIFRRSSVYISGYERPQNPPLTKEEAENRKQRIAVQLEKMKKLLETMKNTPEELNGKYLNIFKKNRKFFHKHGKNTYWKKQGRAYFSAADGQIFFRGCGCRSKTMKSIQELSNYLLLHGVSLIMVICPDACDISARMMNEELTGLPDYNAANITKQLLEHGVETLYISDAVMDQAARYDLMFYYPGDPHPAEGTQQVAARLISQYLKRHFPEVCRTKYHPEHFTEKPKRYETTDWIKKTNQELWAAWFPQGSPFYQQILLDGKPITSDPTSQVILYGNSFLHTPGDSTDKYLPAALTRELKMGVYVMHRVWIHPLTTMLLDLLQNPEQHLKGKKVCVFYYGVSHFNLTEIWNIRELDQIKRQNSIIRPQSGKTKK